MRSAICAVVALLFFCSTANAVVFQSDDFASVTFGPGENGVGNCMPFGCVPETRYQQVYAASSFSGSLTITGITFFNQLYSAGSIDPAHYTVRLSSTKKAAGRLDLYKLDKNIGQHQREFFSGILSGSLASDRFFTIQGTPYSYDPAKGNLLLEIYKTGGTTPWGEGDCSNQRSISTALRTRRVLDHPERTTMKAQIQKASTTPAL